VIWTTGVGQHQMWAMQYLPCERPRSFLTSGGHGTMGFGLPAAIGARAAAPEATVVCVDGDGSFLMTCQELGTAVAERLPVIVVVLDNGGLGMVRQWQEMFYAGRLSVVDTAPGTDIAAVARGFGARAYTVGTATQLQAAFAEALACRETCVLAVKVAEGEHLYPMIHPGSAALGPAIGGLRIHRYDGLEAGVVDALRLARAMTLKNAAAGLDFGGGKAVLFDDGRWDRREARLGAFADVLERLGGRYITAEDVGTSPADMDVLARGTRWVAGRSPECGGGGDPSPDTARTVFGAIEAAVRVSFKRPLDGITVGVLGVGKVGSTLTEMLVEAGAVVEVADVEARRASELAKRLDGVSAVAPDGFIGRSLDVLAPCDGRADRRGHRRSSLLWGDRGSGQQSAPQPDDRGGAARCGRSLRAGLHREQRRDPACGGRVRGAAGVGARGATLVLHRADRGHPGRGGSVRRAAARNCRQARLGTGRAGSVACRGGRLGSCQRASMSS
jgi:hypothetical protein